MKNTGRNTADVLIRWRHPLLLIGIALAIVAAVPSSQLDFDRSIENMFAPSDPLLPPYQKLKRTFGGNEIVMVVYRDEHLLAADNSGIERLRRLSHELKEINGIKDVLSLAQIDDAMRRINNVLQQEYERIPEPLRVVLRASWTALRVAQDAVPRPFRMAISRLDPDNLLGRGITDPHSALARRFLDLFEGYTHGEDRQTAAIVCMLEPESESDASRRATIAAMRSVITNLDGFPPVMLGGEPVMVVDGFQYVEEDGRRLGWASTILLALTIIVCFRSIRWVIIPVAVVQLTLLLTKASLVVGNFRLSMVSSMLTAIVTVVGVATVVHVIVRFRDGRTAGMSPREAIRNAIALLAAPVCWACATDAVGFASLLVTSVGPIQDFGVMMAVGSLLVIVSVALLIPGLTLLKLPRPLQRLDAGPQRAWREQTLDAQLARLMNSVQQRPLTVGLVTMLLSVALALGVFRIKVESDFTRNFRQGSPIVQSYEFIETNLGGAGVWDITVPAPQKLNWDYLQRVQRLEVRLREEAGITTDDTTGRLTKILSIADAIDRLPPFPLEQLPGPVRDVIIDRMLTEMHAAMPTFMDALYGEDPENPGHHYLRIMLRARERQPSAAKRELIEQVESIVDDELDDNQWQQFLGALPATPAGPQPKAEVTGFFVLLTSLIDSMLRDQWLAFGVAVVAIALTMCVALSDLRTALVALVPNVMPIVMVLGLMGWLGLKINMGAAMIAAVSMGLSIDSSIHYITSFRRAVTAGKTVHQSLDEVQQTVGRAMVFSTLALIVGFTSLCFSNFVPIIYFGMLVSLSMLGGLFGNLVVLPLLLKLVTRES